MTFFLFRLLVLAALIAGCGQAPQTNSGVSTEAPTGESAPSRGDEVEPKQDEAEGADKAPGAAPASATPAAARLIIYHADLRVKVEEMPAAAAALEKAVQAAGGWTSGLAETREAGEWHTQ